MIVGNMALELSEGVRSHIDILSKKGLSQHLIMAKLKVCKWSTFIQIIIRAKAPTP